MASDGVPDTELPEAGPGEAAGRARLTYPFPAVPGREEAIEVAPGVLWLRLSMPIALDHINLYALEDGDGWTVVDTGLGTPDSKDAWRALLAGPLGGRPVKRVICTHMHPDHVGLAGWLTRKFQCRLWMSRLEYVTARMLLSDTGKAAPEDGVRFYVACGWDEAQIERYKARFGQFGMAVTPFPDSYRRLSEGEVLSIGGREWRVVGGNGHSPEHVCLYRADDEVLISGDQVLPKISSNVSVWPTEPDADPLTDWLDSLARLKTELPGDCLVLPSHGEPFTGLHGRLDHLARGHERALSRLLKLLEEPRRSVDVFGALFARPIGDGLMGMATGESVAHLNCLRTRGLAEPRLDENGVAWWRATDKARALKTEREAA